MELGSFDAGLYEVKKMNKKMYICLSVCHILNIFAALHCRQTADKQLTCCVILVMLVRSNTAVAWLSECSPKGRGCLIAM